MDERELRQLLETLDRRLDELERTVDRLEYRVVKKNGPLVDEIKANREAIREVNNKLATRDQIEQALRAQTSTLTRTARERSSFQLSRFQTIIAAAAGAVLLVDAIFTLVHYL